jgi:hypothetical protein
MNMVATAAIHASVMVIHTAEVEVKLSAMVATREVVTVVT